MKTLLCLLSVSLVAPALHATQSVAGDGSIGWSPAKRTATETVDRHGEALGEATQRIWELAELALKERESADILCGLLEAEGFELERGIADMPTAFVATFGSGEPVVSFLAEYDALPTLSQKAQAAQEARVAGAGGHGCGHNLFGVASVGAAIALKQAMTAHDLDGTVRLFGTPAEEQGIGKVYLVRDGWFDEVDVCLSWHPSEKNRVSMQPSKALRSFEVTFHGRSAHASGAPWEGVSALDALEAFTGGINLLREHMPESARIHYVITDGGVAPNVVPNEARAWLYVRGKDWREAEKVYQHVLKIVEAADLVAWGEEHGKRGTGYRPAGIRLLTGLYDYNINVAGSRLVHANLELVGAPAFTAGEHEFARELQRAFGIPAEGMHAEITPFDPTPNPEPGGSTDVANISWVTPTVGLRVACWPLECPAHSWASTAASGTSGARRGMLTAAKVLALSGIDVLTRPDDLAAMRKEFEASLESFDYEPAVGADSRPSLPRHMR